MSDRQTIEQQPEESAPDGGSRGNPDPKLPKGDQLLDQGVFVTTANGRLIGQERFMVIREAKRGFLKRRGGGLAVLSSLSSAESASVLHTRFDYDRHIQPVSVELKSDSSLTGGPSGWSANFSLKTPNAKLTIKAAPKPMGMTIPFEKGWLIDVSNSVMPLYMLPGRYDWKRGGKQHFTCVAYGGEQDHFDIGRNALDLEAIDTVRTREGEGLDYLICDEFPLTGPERIRDIVARRIHLWTDREQRLRKAVIATAGDLIAIIRQGEEETLEPVRPFANLLKPRELDMALKRALAERR